ncbi:uracil-DNA glycosylase family protein [Membranihabitans marinus]|uniref:uracil-DNA glycosylase family protein n=1 Tax=Membranihabitans marinus TaxID=1227546 RepID=UPI001F3AAB8B|nr:uracil-DNA glycosylase family protein [Membranihabitans marinus]
MEELLTDIGKCVHCLSYLPHGVRPVLTASTHSKIVIIGQAPGRKVHQSGIPWDDKSGDNLRNWLGIDKETFYDAHKIALIPMGFCYPGTGKSGDLPPRKECAPLWHQRLWDEMPSVELTILIGQYALKYYLKNKTKKNLTDTVLHFEEYLPQYFVLPHPSPRNNIWKARNPWFDETVLPQLRNRVETILR